MELKAAEVLIAKELIAARVRVLASEISKKYDGQSLTVIGILRGAVIFMADLVREISPSVNVVMEFMKAASYGASTTSSGKVTISQGTGIAVKGRNILIVEDIVDTGLTLQHLRGYFKDEGAASVEVCVLLDKRERRVVDVPVEYTGFVIPDEFVVGYGMDYDQKMRNLPSIHTVRSVSE